MPSPLSGARTWTSCGNSTEWLFHALTYVMMHGFTPRALTVEETIKKPCKGTMQVLVFESGCSGHRMRFTRLVAQAATALATRVVVALPNNARSLMEFKEEEEALRQCAQVDDWFEPPRVAGLFRAMRLIPLLQESIRRAQADWVYIPYADGLTQALGLTRGVPRFRMPAGTTIEALHLRGTAAYPQPDWRAHLKAEWSSRLTRRGPWTILHWLDPLSFAHAYRSDSNLVNRIRLMPDPALPGPRIDRSDARVELRVPRRGRYIGCVGKMDRRKGIDLLLGAFLHANLSDRRPLITRRPSGRQHKTIAAKRICGPCAETAHRRHRSFRFHSPVEAEPRGNGCCVYAISESHRIIKYRDPCRSRRATCSWL